MKLTHILRQPLLEKEELKDTTKKFIVYPDFKGVDPANISGQDKVINVKDALGNEPNKDYKYFTSGKLPDGTEVKQYVDNMIQNAKNDGWKSFKPVVAIEHPLLSGKYVVIDGNHRLGAFKMGEIPQINATILSYDDILLATPGTKWQEGKTPETVALKDAKTKGIDLKQYFTTKDLQTPLNENETPKKEVVLLMVVKDNKVLLFKRSETDKSNPGKWAMIGGGVDAGETAEQALTREVKEEAGVFLKNFTSLKKYGYGNVILNIFYTNTFDDENIKLNKEHSEYKYFTMEELENEENTIATNIQFVKDYNAVSEKNEKLNEQLNKMRNLI
jgi:mutator protein MutT